MTGLYLIGSTVSSGTYLCDRKLVKEFNDNVLFFFGGVVLGRLVNLVLQLFGAQRGFLSAEESFQPSGPVDGPAADAAERKMDDLDDAGCIIGKLQVILDGPDLGHDFAEENHDETDEDHFNQEFEKPEVLFEQDHFVDEEVGENDDRDIDDAVGYEQGGQQGTGFFEQGDDSPPGGVLFGLEDIDVLIGQGEEGDFGACDHKGKDEQEKDNNGEDRGCLRIDNQEFR